MYADESPYKQLPRLSEYEQLLVSFWHSCGTVGQTTGGISRLEWSEIKSWADQFYSESITEYVEDSPGVFIPTLVTQCTLFDYELEIIQFLSIEYAGEYTEAKTPSRPCPKEIDLESLPEEDKLAESKALVEGFKALFGGSKE